MKLNVLAAGAVLCLAFGLSGCNDPLLDLSSPQATQAAKNVQTVATAIDCTVAAGSAAALQDEQTLGSSGQTATKSVSTISSQLCPSK